MKASANESFWDIFRRNYRNETSHRAGLGKGLSISIGVLGVIGAIANDVGTSFAFYILLPMISYALFDIRDILAHKSKTASVTPTPSAHPPASPR